MLGGFRATCCTCKGKQSDYKRRFAVLLKLQFFLGCLLVHNESEKIFWNMLTLASSQTKEEHLVIFNSSVFSGSKMFLVILFAFTEWIKSRNLWFRFTFVFNISGWELRLFSKPFMSQYGKSSQQVPGSKWLGSCFYFWKTTTDHFLTGNSHWHEVMALWKTHDLQNIIRSYILCMICFFYNKSLIKFKQWKLEKEETKRQWNKFI